jgi:hypothetical protein
MADEVLSKSASVYFAKELDPDRRGRSVVVGSPAARSAYEIRIRRPLRGRRRERLPAARLAAAQIEHEPVLAAVRVPPTGFDARETKATKRPSLLVRSGRRGA